MSYVRSVLQPGEKIIAVGRLHWIIYDGAMLTAILGIVLLLIAPRFNPNLESVTRIFAIAVLVLALGWAAKAWFDQWITEIAVTNLRVIYKTGFIRRYTAEMHMEKVESVTVNQSVLGRILGYGTIHVRGVGVGIEHLHRIASPVTLRNAIVAR